MRCECPGGGVSSFAIQLAGLYHELLAAGFGAGFLRAPVTRPAGVDFVFFHGVSVVVVFFQADDVPLLILSHIDGSFVERLEDAKLEPVFLPVFQLLSLALAGFSSPWNGFQLGKPQPSAVANAGTTRTHRIGNTIAIHRAVFTAVTPEKGSEKECREAILPDVLAGVKGDFYKRRRPTRMKLSLLS